MAVLSDDIFAKLETLRTQTDAANAQAGDIGTAQRLGGYASRYWWMDPGAMWSLAKSGIDPADLTAQMAAASAAHIQNQGLAFQPLGSPVGKPTTVPDTTDVFARLDQLQQQQTAPQPQSPIQPAGPASSSGVDAFAHVRQGLDAINASQSPIERMVGAERWGKLAPDEQAQLSKLSFTAAQAPINKYVGADNSYEVAGVDSPQVATLLQRVLPANSVRLYGPWAGLSQDIHGKQMPADAVDPQDAQGSYRVHFTGQAFQNPGVAQQITQGTDIIAQGLPLAGTGLRAASLALSAPLQEVQGGVRDLYQIVHDHQMPTLHSQSDLGVVIGDLASGRNVDIGNGIFVDQNSQVHQELIRRQLEHGNINGQGVTLGRWIANTVLQPGSKPYNLLSGTFDAALAFKADPTIKLLGEAQAAREADKLFTSPGSVGQAIRTFRETGEVTPALQAFSDAGGLSGIRPTVSKDAVNTWLASPDTQPLLQRIADQPDAYTIWRGLNRKADPALAAALADTNDPQQVANLLRDSLGTTIREKPEMADFPGGRQFFPHIGGDGDPIITPASMPSRWRSMMPAQTVDSTDAQANVTALEQAAPLVKANSEQLNGWFDRMARARTPTERLAAWQQVMNDTAEHLTGNGIAAERARQLTRIGQEAEAVDRVYAVRAVGAGQGIMDQQAVVDGRPQYVTDNQPTMLAQTLDSDISLPDWRMLRKALAPAPVRAILENPSIQGGEYLLNRAQNTVWKALQISTVKTMIKVIGDEQFSMAGRGYDSLINHPISALSNILATHVAELPEDAGFIARLQNASSKLLRTGLEHLPGVEPQLTATALGHDFDTLTEMQQVASHGFDSALDTRGVLHAEDWRVLPRMPGVNDTEFLTAHGRHVAQYAASPETRGFANADTLQAAQDAYWDGDLAKFREQLSRVGREGRPELLTREGSDAYVAKMVNQMQTVTNGNPALMDAIATGRLDGAKIWNTARDGTPRVSKTFTDRLANYEDDFPNATPQQKAIYSADYARRQVADSMFGRAVHLLLGTPSAVLSKSPLFRQAYWERIADNAPFMSADAQNAALKMAETANIGDRLRGDLLDGVVSGNRNREPFSGTLTLEQADQIAKGHALDIVRRTTHEFSQRSQAFDQLRLLTPFGEVWRKTIQRWASIINENPGVVRRAMQGIQAAQSPELGSLMGAPAGQGFFHTDSNGQEVFTVPGSEWATQALTGVPVPLVGDVKGLSVGTEFFPALGPVVSIPVAYAMQKLNLMNQKTPIGTLGETLFPYGPPGNIGDLWNYMPSWFKTALGHDRPTSPDSIRTYNNTVIDFIRYGVTNGDYDTSTSAGIQHAMEDASAKADKEYWIRGAAQFFVPGAPSPQMLLRDKTGKLIDASLMVQAYKQLTDEDPNTAGQKFIDQYGPDVFKSMTSKSYAYVFGVPTSADSAQWVKDHPSLQRDLPHIYGYFAPPSDPNKFDYQTYLDQLQPGGGRAALSPEQWTKVANARLAALQYGNYRDKVDAANGGKAPNANQRAWLAMVKQNLMNEYPGYADALYGGNGLPSRPDSKLLLQEATVAANDPTVKGTDAGKGLVSYLSVQDKVDAAWTKAGFAPGTWQTSNGEWAINLRTYMRQVGANVEKTNPQFGPLFDDVFDRAMRVDTDPRALTPGGG